MITKAGPADYRMWLLNQFHECVRWEVLPAIHADIGGQAMDVITTRASIGAFNAVAAAVPPRAHGLARPARAGPYLAMVRRFPGRVAS
jgi:hypothetical protein